MFLKLLLIFLALTFSVNGSLVSESKEQSLIENTYFGSPEYYQLSEKEWESLISYCAVKTDTITCKKVELFSGPYGDCARKIRYNQTIAEKYEELESFVADFTKYGLARKCLLLKEKKSKMGDGIASFCGNLTAKIFSKSIADFKHFYDC